MQWNNLFEYDHMQTGRFQFYRKSIVAICSLFNMLNWMFLSSEYDLPDNDHSYEGSDLILLINH